MPKVHDSRNDASVAMEVAAFAAAPTPVLSSRAQMPKKPTVKSAVYECTGSLPTLLLMIFRGWSSSSQRFNL